MEGKEQKLIWTKAMFILMRFSFGQHCRMRATIQFFRNEDNTSYKKYIIDLDCIRLPVFPMRQAKRRNEVKQMICVGNQSEASHVMIFDDGKTG